MGKRMIGMLIGVGIVFGGIFGYQAFGNYMMKQYFANVKPPVVVVSTIEVVNSSWQSKLKAVGDLRAAKGVEISSEVPGQVKTVRFNSGDDVKEGDILLELNTDTDEAQLKAIEAAAELSKISYERDKKQLEIQAVSQAQVDASAAELKTRLALVDQQKALLAKKTVRAPFSGKLGISSVNPGRYLNPGETIVTLQALDPIRVDFFVPQQDIARLSIGLPVTLVTDAHPGRSFEGKITAFNPRVEKDSRNILIEATLANPQGELLPGMFVPVEVATGSPVNYMTIPQTSVSFNPYGETVYLVEEKEKDKDGKPVLIARQTFIKTGDSRGDQIAVTDGVKVGDTIVFSGQHKLKNGSAITINNQTRPLNEAAPKPQED